MKKSKFIFAAIITLLLFAVIGAFASTVDVMAFSSDPVLFIIDNFTASNVITAGFPFYGAVVWPSGESNMGGTKNRAYFIPLDGFTGFPEIPTSPSTAEEYHTLAGSITLVQNCNVIELYATYKTGTLKADVEGEIDGKFFKLTPEFFHPGSKADIINFASSCVNTPGILFLPVDDYYLVVGSPGHPVYLSPAFDLGKVGEGRKGTMFTGEAYSELMLTKYKGTLPLVPASS
jgi:hypothetical protein